jgi:hypothetical protein
MRNLDLVARHLRINLLRPGVDAAGHILHLRKTLLTQPLRHPHAAAAMVAMNDDSRVAQRFELTQAAGDFPHGNQLGPLNASSLMLVGLSAIEQRKWLTGRAQLLHSGDIDFKRQWLSGHKL